MKFFPERNAFTALSVSSLLDADPRPTFVIESTASDARSLNPVFCNQAIRRVQRVYTVLILQEGDLLAFQNVCDLAICDAKARRATARSYYFAGLQWQTYLVSENWIVFSCLDFVEDTYTPGVHSSSKLDNTLGNPPNFDWTSKDPSSLSDHLQFLCAHEWGTTSLGRKEDWSLELRVTLNLLNSNPEPAIIYWGKELNGVYNEPFIDLVGQKHPHILGHGPDKAFPEVNT